MGPLTLGLVVSALAACGQPSATTSPPTSTTSPAASTTVSVPVTSTSPTPPTVTPTPSNAGVLATTDFSCRLPLVATVGQASQSGFITFPAGTFSADAAGNIKSKSYGLAYDRVFGRWLPVDWRFVSDDGLHYTYAVYPADIPTPGLSSVIHVVDVASGRDRVVLSSGQYTIVDYTAGGIYLTAWVGGHDGPGPQVGWLLDPVSGALRALSGGATYGYWIGAGAGWRTDYNPADPTVHQGMTGPNRLTRVDLSTASEASWFYQQGADSIQLLGFDRQGLPIVASGVGSTFDTWLLRSAQDRTRLFSGADLFLGGGLADTHGIWFSGQSGTYLYDGTHGLRRVSSAFGQIAGGCH